MSPSAESRFVVIIGPGGTGKGTVARRLIDRDPSLWLSRSWTTRPPREGEDLNAYVFVDQETFQGHIERDGFLEWAEFLGHFYGSPVPEPREDQDVLLEIEVEGAHQVVGRFPQTTVILLLPPSEEMQIERLRGRGDPEERVQERVAKGREEIARGRMIATHEVVNDDLERAVGEVTDILKALRTSET